MELMVAERWRSLQEIVWEQAVEENCSDVPEVELQERLTRHYINGMSNLEFLELLSRACTKVTAIRP